MKRKTTTKKWFWREDRTVAWFAEKMPTERDQMAMNTLVVHKTASMGPGWFAGTLTSPKSVDIGPFDTAETAMAFTQSKDFLTLIRIRQEHETKEPY